MQFRRAIRPRAGLTLLEVTIAMLLFAVTVLGLTYLYLSNARLNTAAEERYRALNAIRAQVAQTRLRESEGLGAYDGLDAVIRDYLTAPDFAVENLTPNLTTEVGSVTVLTDLNGDDVFEPLVDPDSYGTFVEETSGATLVETANVYDVDVIRLDFDLSWVSKAGGTSGRAHSLTLARKWEQ